MRATIITPILCLGATVFAQDLAGLPVCAQTAAITAATSSGCGLTDANCLCNSSGFIASLKATISGSCTGGDQQSACAWGNSACASYGVSIDCNLATAASPSSMMSIMSGAMTGSSAGTSPVSSPGMTSSTMPASESGSAAIESSSMNSGDNTPMSSMMSSMTTSTMLGNGTVACTHGCGNMTHAATSMVSRTGSAPTSQYTGAASTAARQSGVIGVVIGASFVLALF